MTQPKVHIGLIDPKSPENVESVMRLAGNFSVDSVYFSGERYPKAAKLKPCTVDMSRKVSRAIPLTQVDNFIDDPIVYMPNNLKIVCVEFAENAILLPEYQHPKNALYIFGSEDSTITQQLIDRADDVVYVPTVSCMNLSATVSVVLYDRLAKSSQGTVVGAGGNELIRQSRDTNNGLKVSSASA
ncbi:RNA methyltransferase, TrmH family [hydrothermal vent metagenome]|uniref:RNA methyltransferase, TrmH family n=1 Tax=hydrothermal vent metagenome TaxID=652676 RepID=A0A3B0X7A7_9ZZZZ